MNRQHAGYVALFPRYELHYHVLLPLSSILPNSTQVGKHLALYSVALSEN